MIKATLQRLLNAMGYQVIKSNTGFSPEELAVIKSVEGYCASSAERMVGLINAVKYIAENRVPGAVVECGVWRGGSMMIAARTLLELKDAQRDLYLFDTFAGMAQPTAEDVSFDGQKATEVYNASEHKEGAVDWCLAGLADVQRNMRSTGYPETKLHFVKGLVEETIPAGAPEQIALLRLDTDWYESTSHELKHLYSRVVPHGVIIIDDYGHWQGARKAVDEFFAGQPFKPMLNRLDYTGRLMIKPK